MNKKIGLFWLRDDFRITKNLGLCEATKNHDEVVVFYLYKKSVYQNQEAQKWWLSKSLLNFKNKLLRNFISNTLFCGLIKVSIVIFNLLFNLYTYIL